MDPKEVERVVVSKPVASRPTSSNFRSFSELLAGAINSSLPNSSSEITVPTIRPKTIRFKPTSIHHPPTGLISSQAGISESADANNTNSESNKSSVVFKPRAKLVSRRTVSLLANMGNFSSNSHSNSQQTPHHTVPQTSNASIEPSKIVGEDPKSVQHPMAHCDRPSYDGYNWRKYGQKQVKGSEYPRSYYKCTHPNCPVKKKVERSLDGQIAEIVYKGEHNHSKPQPPKRNSSVLQGTVSGPDRVGEETNNNLFWSNFPNKKNDGSEGRIENRNEVGSSIPEKATLPYESVPDNSCGVSGECEESQGKGVVVEEDEPRSKRRKRENQNQSSEAGISGEGVEPRIVVQNSNDSEILGDGFRWRKYGQKVVKGYPYPRSYYRCTSPKCNVRKHVERASEDPKAFITTYEGKHNHAMPTTKNTHPAAAGSETDSKAQSSKHRQ